MSTPNNQKAIFLPAERFAQFMAYANNAGLGRVDAFEHIFKTAMEAEQVYYNLPSFDVREELYSGHRCVSLGTHPRIRLKGAVEVQLVHDALMHAQDRGHKVVPVEVTPEIGNHTIEIRRKGTSVQLYLDGKMYKLTYRLAFDLANELMAAMGRANGL